MNAEGRAIVEALRADPQDAGARGAFADWLQEHGETVAICDQIRYATHVACSNERGQITFFGPTFIVTQHVPSVS